MIPESIVDNYINKCQDKINKHSINSKNSRIWNNLLGTLNILISAMSALTMTIMTVAEVDSAGITIVGATYAFLITVFTKVKDDYEFNLLNFRHASVMDDYSELNIQFEKLKYEFDNVKMESCIIKYESINKNSHIQDVKICYLGNLCCF